MERYPRPCYLCGARAIWTCAVCGQPTCEEHGRLGIDGNSRDTCKSGNSSAIKWQNVLVSFCSLPVVASWNEYAVPSGTVALQYVPPARNRERIVPSERKHALPH